MDKMEKEALCEPTQHGDAELIYPESQPEVACPNDRRQTAFTTPNSSRLDHQVSRDVELKPPKQLGATVVMPLILLPREAADYIGKSEKWLEADRRNGPTIPYLKLGRSVRYRAEDLLDIINRHIVTG